MSWKTVALMTRVIFLLNAWARVSFICDFIKTIYRCQGLAGTHCIPVFRHAVVSNANILSIEG